MVWLLFTILSSAFTLTGIAMTKNWVASNKPHLFVLALVLYTLSGLSYMFALRSERVVLIESVWTTVVLLATLALGFFIYHERISMQEGIGIIFAIIAAILLTIKFPM